MAAKHLHELKNHRFAELARATVLVLVALATVTYAGFRGAAVASDTSQVPGSSDGDSASEKASDSLSPNSGPDAGGTKVTVRIAPRPLTDVETGDGFAVALGSDGRLYSWGGILMASLALGTLRIGIRSRRSVSPMA